MATGLLRVKGTIDIDQFWPMGTSDADTAKVLLDTGPGAFKFRAHPNTTFQNTNAFRNTRVVGQGRKPAIDNQGRITIRLQGIDAPELHYRPKSIKTDREGRTAQEKERYLRVNEEYRQHLAETATVKLADLLRRANRNPIPCTVETAVDYPDDVFDVYGRFIGDIIVHIQGRDYNINHWLVEQGLAYPAFYNSMSEDEIETLRDAANRAWAAGRFVWAHLADYAGANDGAFDWSLQVRRPTANPVYSQSADLGTVVIPKLFRRLSIWEINKYAWMFEGTFWSYLDTHRDRFYLTDEFLAQPTSARLYSLHEFLDQDLYFYLWPEDLVFQEAGSKLIDAQGNTVLTW